MGKKITLEIEETREQLLKLKNKQTSLPKQKRVLALLHIKEGSIRFRADLAKELCVDRKTLRRWLHEYNEGGINKLLEVRPKFEGSRIITAEIHEGLKQRVEDPHNSFNGYWEAQDWIKREYGVDVKYHRVRGYLIKHFGTKVKRPRKSHIKKDEGAVALFKNATRQA